MKEYLKPTFMKVQIKGNITSLNDWLTNMGTEYVDAGITTYSIES